MRLTRKLAQRIDGIDLSGAQVGELLDLPVQDALLLVAEGWAVAEPPGRERSSARVRRAASSPDPCAPDRHRHIVVRRPGATPRGAARNPNTG